MLAIAIHLIKSNGENVSKFLLKLEELLKQSISFKRILDNLSEGIVLIDQSFNCAYQNFFALNTSGLEKDNSSVRIEADQEIDIVAKDLQIFKFQKEK